MTAQALEVVGVVVQRERHKSACGSGAGSEAVNALFTLQACIPITTRLRTRCVHFAARTTIRELQENATALALFKLARFLFERVVAGVFGQENADVHAEVSRQPICFGPRDQRLPPLAADAAAEAWNRFVVREAAKLRVVGTPRTGRG